MSTLSLEVFLVTRIVSRSWSGRHRTVNAGGRCIERVLPGSSLELRLLTALAYRLFLPPDLLIVGSSHIQTSDDSDEPPQSGPADICSRVNSVAASATTAAASARAIGILSFVYA